MTTITLNQKKSSSFLSSLLFFIGITGLTITFFFLGKRHYQQSENESENYEFFEDTFEPLPDNELPPPKRKKEKEPLWELTHPQILDRLAKQRKWKSKTLPLLSNEETIKEIDIFLKFFYKEFFKRKLNTYEEKWLRETKTKLIVRPKKVDGRATTEKTLINDIDKCKKIFPETKEAGIKFKGFGGWLTAKEKGEKEKDDTVLMGLCVNNGGTKKRWKKSWGKESVCYWTVKQISIKLKPELFYFHHKSWFDKNRINPKTGKPLQIRIGWDELIETIAHELAHAVINRILIDDKVAKLNEGHGELHDDITERIKKMIENSHELNNFKNYINGLV